MLVSAVFDKSYDCLNNVFPPNLLCWWSYGRRCPAVGPLGRFNISGAGRWRPSLPQRPWLGRGLGAGPASSTRGPALGDPLPVLPSDPEAQPRGWPRRAPAPPARVYGTWGAGAALELVPLPAAASEHSFMGLIMRKAAVKSQRNEAQFPETPRERFRARGPRGLRRQREEGASGARSLTGIKAS